MSAEESKAILRRGAEAFNDCWGRSGWFDIHDSSVVAGGLAPHRLGVMVQLGAMPMPA